MTAFSLFLQGENVARERIYIRRGRDGARGETVDAARLNFGGVNHSNASY
jgi:hypothetical protein